MPSTYSGEYSGIPYDAGDKMVISCDNIPHPLGCLSPNHPFFMFFNSHPIYSSIIFARLPQLLPCTNLHKTRSVDRVTKRALLPPPFHKSCSIHYIHYGNYGIGKILSISSRRRIARRLLLALYHTPTRCRENYQTENSSNCRGCVTLSHG